MSHSGIIPAGAGKSPTGDGPDKLVGDHPRGCGEKVRTDNPLICEQGSSPRVRGKERLGTKKKWKSRIIPAGAGKRNRLGRSTSRSKDHPRGCGEKPSCREENTVAWGSSPRVRGKDQASAIPGRRDRIIPAGAGKRRSLSPISVVDGDHPRGCGEKFKLQFPDEFAKGSSPRVRGKAPPRAKPLRGPGIIPAGAGKSNRHRNGFPTFQDHPRGCGEKNQKEGC